ncbi:hypothetical protein ETD83_20830 [Actinomadura soli]|uniref:Methionyl-tRNA formyltransferase n=1 Tax=Actinomadura soli TaxID=2508997 RepID=A0A5C4J907_9ACTN|nr:formyltransferase family protein [Actinomadura soli]TMQ96804.1 hypothetical protein ETD83_20830 [Actinomadura soli]
MAKERPRAVFISSHVFGAEFLAGMLARNKQTSEGISFELVVTVQPSPAISTVGVVSLDRLAAEHSIPHLAVPTVKSPALAAQIHTKQPDYILAIGLSELLPAYILDIPMQVHGARSRHSSAHGVLGVHPTLLPQGRGRAPIPWTIIKGLKKTGITAFMLEEDADSGGIVRQQEMKLAEHETATSLFQAMSKMHGRLGVELLPALAKRTLTWIDQDTSQVSVWPRRYPEDGLISFSQSTASVDRLIRGLTKPYPGAFFYYRDQKIVVNSAIPTIQGHGVPTGQIIEVNSLGLPIVACGDGYIECIDIEVSDTFNFQVGESVEPRRN